MPATRCQLFTIFGGITAVAAAWFLDYVFTLSDPVASGTPTRPRNVTFSESASIDRPRPSLIPWLAGVRQPEGSNKSRPWPTTKVASHLRDTGTGLTVEEEVRKLNIEQPLGPDGPKPDAIEHFDLTEEQVFRIGELQMSIVEKASRNFHERLVFHDGVEGCDYMVEYTRDESFHEKLKQEFYRDMFSITGEPFASASLIWLKTEYAAMGYLNHQQVRFYVNPIDPDPQRYSTLDGESLPPDIMKVRIQTFLRGKPSFGTMDLPMSGLRYNGINLERPSN